MRRINVSNDVSISIHLGTNQSKPLYWSDTKAQMAFYNTADYKKSSCSHYFFIIKMS